MVSQSIWYLGDKLCLVPVFNSRCSYTKYQSFDTRKQCAKFKEVGTLVSLCWTSGDIYPKFQSEGGSLTCCSVWMSLNCLIAVLTHSMKHLIFDEHQGTTNFHISQVNVSSLLHQLITNHVHSRKVMFSLDQSCQWFCSKGEGDLDHQPPDSLGQVDDPPSQLGRWTPPPSPETGEPHFPRRTIQGLSGRMRSFLFTHNFTDKASDFFLHLNYSRQGTYR